MNYIKRLWGIILFVVMVSSIAVVGVSYHLIRTTCSRSFILPKEQKRILEKRSILVNQFNGEPVEFITSDGIKLAGLLFKRANAQKVIIAAHGYFQSKELMMHVVDMCSNDHVLLFDFRGHGQSCGDTISIGYHERKDVFSAIKFLQECGIGNSLPLIGVGNSMGSATLIGAVAQGASFDALILDSGFANLENQLNKTFTTRTGFPKKPFLTIAMKLCRYMGSGNLEDVAPVEWIKSVLIPVLIIHSNSDHMVLLSDAQALYANAPGSKELWIVPGARHGNVWAHDYKQYKKRVNEFIDKYALKKSK